MIFCPNCGTPMEDDARFCVQCGTPVDPETLFELLPQPELLQEPEIFAEKRVYALSQRNLDTTSRPTEPIRRLPFPPHLPSHRDPPSPAPTTRRSLC